MEYSSALEVGVSAQKELSDASAVKLIANNLEYTSALAVGVSAQKELSNASAVKLIANHSVLGYQYITKLLFILKKNIVRF